MFRPGILLRIPLVCTLMLLLSLTYGQNIGINVNGAAPDASALLDIDVSAISGPKRGLLIPRMTSGDRVGIVAPATGLLVYDTTTNGFWYFNGTAWEQLTSGGPGWLLTGNAGTVAGTNFLGTTDAVPLEVRVNNTRAGFLGLGPVSTPGANTSWGHAALLGNTAGYNNSAFGYQALTANVGASNNSAFGSMALASTTSGGDNTAVGSEALFNNTNGGMNTAVGSSALAANTTGQKNSATGASALRNSTTGSNNTATGFEALYNNTSGSENTATGYRALYASIGSNGNSAFGWSALGNMTSGSNNTAVGSNALASTTSAGSNTAVGTNALFANITGSENTATGRTALQSNTTGTYNTAFGSRALQSNTTANHSTAIGSEALQQGTGQENTAVGFQALYNSYSGSSNTALGTYADVLSGWLTRSTAIGYNAKVATSSSLVLGGTGADAVNVGIGTTSPTLAGLQVERAAGNTAGLFRAGSTSQGVALVTDWPGIYLNCYYNGLAVTSMAGTGYPSVINSNQTNGGILFNTTSTANTAPNVTVVVPERMRITGAGLVGIGTATPSYLLEVNGTAAKPGGGSWTVSSDARLKTNVADYTDGLDQLLRIRPVRFHYNEASGHDTKPEYVGVIAQELKEVAPYMVGSFEKDGTEYLNVDNSAMVYMLVNSVRELEGQVQALREQVRVLKAGSVSETDPSRSEVRH